jgi:ABC-type ATPase with predicted acetyltransferase domain
MPSFDVLKEHTATESFRVAAVRGLFDLKSCHVTERFSGAIEIEEKDWNVGVICGASGSGKSTIARAAFDVPPVQPYTHDSIVDDMPPERTVTEITQAFVSVAFGTAPNWLKSYSVLSTGEQMRCDLARALLSHDDPIVFDEFTSVINREVAKAGSYAVQKAVRRSGRRFVAVTCHRDVLDWLEPDWVYDTDLKQFFFAEATTDGQRSALTCEKYQKLGNECFGTVLKSIII